jgi:hypothetical protein
MPFVAMSSSWLTCRALEFGKVHAVNEGSELRFGQRADLGRFDIAALEQHQGRDAADAVLGRGRLVVVDVDLGTLSLPA